MEDRPNSFQLISDAHIPTETLDAIPVSMLIQETCTPSVCKHIFCDTSIATPDNYGWCHKCIAEALIIAMVHGVINVPDYVAQIGFSFCKFTTCWGDENKNQCHRCYTLAMALLQDIQCQIKDKLREW